MTHRLKTFKWTPTLLRRGAQLIYHTQFPEVSSKIAARAECSSRQELIEEAVASGIKSFERDNFL